MFSSVFFSEVRDLSFSICDSKDRIMRDKQHNRSLVRKTCSQVLPCNLHNMVGGMKNMPCQQHRSGSCSVAFYDNFFLKRIFVALRIKGFALVKIRLEGE